MKRTDLMRDLPKHLHEGCGIEGRAIGREAAEGQGTCRQGRVQTSQKGPDIIVGGIVIQDLIENALVAAIIDGGKNAKGTIIHALLTVLKKWTFDLSMPRVASRRHIFEANVNGFPLVLQVHGAK